MLKEIVLIEWGAVNGLALAVWLVSGVALSMTALPVCGLATGAAGIVLALLFLFPKGCLASLVVHLVIYGFYRVARKHPTAREWGLSIFWATKQ